MQRCRVACGGTDFKDLLSPRRDVCTRETHSQCRSILVQSLSIPCERGERYASAMSADSPSWREQQRAGRRKQLVAEREFNTTVPRSSQSDEAHHLTYQSDQQSRSAVLTRQETIADRAKSVERWPMFVGRRRTRVLPIRCLAPGGIKFSIMITIEIFPATRTDNINPHEGFDQSTLYGSHLQINKTNSTRM